MGFARLLRYFFFLLYHPFAWVYDWVAWAVSLGRWQGWVKTALPYVNGRILELGFGPGHLQATMHRPSWPVFGLDESRQMVAIAARRLRRQGLLPRLVRGRAQALPYPTASFDTVVATFPSEYILEEETLREIGRVLTPSGRLVVVAMAWFTGRKLVYRLFRGLFRLTGESQEIEVFWPRVAARLEATGLRGWYEMVEGDASRVLLVLAEKKP